ncbi:MAG: threonine/serine exporter family protein [Planctomycetota bacterium]|nr:threonine/serine exporter family protein [Pirellulaceae bacterium]MEC7429730.1 threonine/serine exporter family protein [Planctomycetota bacterium]MEC8569438.1 threonine/serine exporter family protein [Planctomycetota bacterium]
MDHPIEEKHEFLLRTAELLQRYGTPSHRLERLMVRVSGFLGVEAAYLYTPTAVIVSFGTGQAEQTRLIRSDAGDVDLGKLVEFDEVLEDLEDGQIDLVVARERMLALSEAPQRYASLAVAVASGVASGGAAVFFGGGIREVLVALVLGGILFGVAWLTQRLKSPVGLFEPLAGFVAATLALWISPWIQPMDDRLATLASLIIILPGLSFTVAMTELASRHLTAGVARLAGTMVSFMTLTLGVALSWRLFAGIRPNDVATEVLPDWAPWLALLIVPPALAILFQARYREWFVIAVVAGFGFLASQLGGNWMGGEFGPFLGALAVGACSNAYARWLDRPASVTYTPGILILVPGSLGYRSLTAFVNQDALEGLELAFATFLVAMSLVGGLLAANALIPPRRIL